MSWRRPLRWLIVVVFTAALAVVAGTLVPRPLWPATKIDTTTGKTYRILVLANPIHTDIAIPIDAETLARFPFLSESGMPVAHPDARWLVFGWGGRAFYIETPTWSELKPVPLFKGLTMDRSVIHADVTGEIVEPSDAVMGYEIGADEYQRLLSFIEASFTRTDGLILPIPDTAYGENDRFFEANGWFSAVVGCNTWTAKALREAGLQTGWWNPLPVSLSKSLMLYN
ncbi:TIGR02117 family protein [Rhizobium sp. PL01]|uniref:TIGR02117 family protein n=1 Tax=Rhizobium sp. PL01 TaxID=3085631 RepID=UPI00298177AD|nr:TIGR02117 family protein [Rhizobium sp. PL01]MDW5312662.1 TIGR02117 family protein [Rhizobium sp. PL01]